METKIKTLAEISFFVLVFIFIYFLYICTTTPPPLGDSTDYHIPIAKSFLDGSFLHPSQKGFGLLYYPAASNVLLTPFLLMHVPLNLYGFLSWIVLFIVTKKLGNVFGLSSYMTIVFAVSVCAWISILREIPTQSIDIWLAVFFSWAIILLEKPKKTLLYFLKLGFASGMIIGSKYSGPLFAGVLLIVYARKLLPFLSLSRLILLIIPFTLFGLSWYIRNYFLTGNPFYPGSILWFNGNSSFKLMDWQPWRTLLQTSSGWWTITQALFSEFLIWSLSLLLVPFYFLKKRKILKQNRDIVKLGFIGIANYLLLFFLPSWSTHIISDLRYTYPAFIPLTLAVFLVAKKMKQEEVLSLIAPLTSIAVLPQFDYYPKLIAVFLFVVLILKKNERTLQKIFEL